MIRASLKEWLIAIPQAVFAFICFYGGIWIVIAVGKAKGLA